MMSMQTWVFLPQSLLCSPYWGTCSNTCNTLVGSATSLWIEYSRFTRHEQDN
jgi:hypothetical protein